MKKNVFDREEDEKWTDVNKENSFKIGCDDLSCCNVGDYPNGAIKLKCDFVPDIRSLDSIIWKN